MAIDLPQLREVVRDSLLNIPTTVVDDDELDEYIRSAKRKLDRDRPRLAVGKIAGTGKSFYKLTGSSPALTPWVAKLSEVISIIYPEPIITNDDDLKVLTYKDYQMYDDGADEYIRFVDALTSGKNAVVSFTAPWLINKLDGATSTTLEDRYTNAIVFLTLAFVCYALSAKSAGTLDSQLPGDIINYRSKELEYRRVGDTWVKRYQEELGIGQEVPAAIVRRDFDPIAPSGFPYISHRRSGGASGR